MAGSVNRVILIGRCTRDPELRSMQDGTRIANLSVATSERWKDRNSGERKEKSEFHRVVIFNERLVEIAEKFLRKGSLLHLEGALQTRSWDKDGEKRYSTEIVLARFRGELTLLDGAKQGEDTAADEPQDRPAPSGGYRDRRTAEPRQQTLADELDDSVPFATASLTVEPGINRKPVIL